MTAERVRRKKARHHLAKTGYPAGGHFTKGGHADEAEDRTMIRKMVKPKALRVHLKDGGCAEGGMPKMRADRKGRGHKGKGHTTVNVLVGHPGGGGAQPVPVPVPKPVPVPVNAGAGMAPGGPAGLPPGGPAGAPPGLKRGGRAKAPKIDSQRDEKGGIPAGHFKKGGRTKGYPIETGSGGAQARLDKAKAYGA